MLIAVKKPDAADLSEEDVIAYLRERIAKWWLPDEVHFVESMPMTGHGQNPEG